MDAETGGIYGVSDIKTWIREPDRESMNKGERKKTPIEQKGGKQKLHAHRQEFDRGCD